MIMKFRIGRIGIAEEDNLVTQAENFAKAYGLPNEMKGRVWKILNASLEKYIDQIAS